MSVMFINMVFDSPAPRGADRLCLLALADYADDSGGSCFPSQKTLARKCAVGRRTIQNTVGRLEADGYVIVERHPGQGSRYQLVADALTPEACCQGQEGATHEAHCVGTGEADCVAPPEVHCHPPTKPTATEPPMNHQLEPPTEPLRSVGSKNGVGSDISTIVAQLRAGGEMDPRLEDKVASLVAKYGIDLVARQCHGVARQYAGKSFGFGLLVKAVEQPDTFHFVDAPPVAGPATLAPPVPGTSRTIEQAAALDKAGITSSEDWQRREAEDFVLWYAPRDVSPVSTSHFPTNGSGGDRAANRGKPGPLANFLQTTQNGGG